jgi:hypothetical protein
VVARPLPGANLVLLGGEPHACRQDPADHPACDEVAAWLAAVDAVARDLFGGRQHALGDQAGPVAREPDAL